MERNLNRWLSIAVFAILFASSYKYDADYFASSQWMSDFEQPYWIIALKRFAPTAFVIPPAIMLLMPLFRARMAYPLRAGSAILGVLLVYECVRFGLGDAGYGLQLSLSGGMVVVLVLVTCFNAGTSQGAEIGNAIARGVCGFAIFHVFINLAMMLSGYGFHLSRFLGTTAQPNFIGVQMAVCAIFLWAAPFFQKHLFNLVRAVALIGALGLLVLSGSRTGLAVFAVAFAIQSYVRGVRPTHAILFTFGLLIAATALFAVDLGAPDLDQYARGGNTRSEPLQYLWSLVNDSPVFGAGILPRFSENSYLRGWAAVGVFFPIFTFIYMGLAVNYALKIKKRTVRGSGQDALAGALIGLLFGGFFEGYLMDSLSFSLFAFVLCALGVEAALYRRASAVDVSEGFPESLRVSRQTRGSVYSQSLSSRDRRADV